MSLSSRFFPSRVNSLQKFTKLIAFSIAPNSSSAPTLVSGAGAGVKSITRNSAGVFTALLTDQFKSLISGNATVQTASPTSTAANASLTVGSGTSVFTVTAGANSPGAVGENLTVTVDQSAQASYTWTDSTDDNNSVVFGAGPAALGAAGNSVAIVIATGSALATTVVQGASLTTVTVTIDTTVTTPTLLATYMNSTAPNGLVVVNSHSGTTPFTVFLSTETLTGGVGFGPTLTVTSDGENQVVYLPVTVSTNAALAKTGAQVVTAWNAQISSGNSIASAGGVGNISTAASAPLTGGTNATASLVAQLGAISGASSTNTAGGTVVVRVVDATTGSATDMTNTAGNQINVELLVKTE